MMDAPSLVGLDELRQWESALAERAKSLKSQIERSTRELEVIEEKMGLVRRLLLLDGVSESVDKHEPIPVNGVSSDSNTFTKIGMLEVEDAVEHLLSQAAAPMHISKIREALIECGASIPGRGDEANIILRLRKQPDRFTRTARGTYALAKWGLPEVKATKNRTSRVRQVKR
jgi:hypothetical protein